MLDVLAATPTWVRELALVAGAFVTVAAAIGVVWKMLKGGWRVASNVQKILHLVEYHLGPNGGNPPLHNRVTRIERRMVKLERAHDIEDDDGDGA